MGLIRFALFVAKTEQEKQILKSLTIYHMTLYGHCLVIQIYLLFDADSLVSLIFSLSLKTVVWMFVMNILKKGFLRYSKFSILNKKATQWKCMCVEKTPLIVMIQFRIPFFILLKILLFLLGL